MSTKLAATKYDVADLEHRLREKPSTRHLRVRKHGSSLILESGPSDDPTQHARLRRDGVHLWILDARGRSRWENTGVRGTMAHVLSALVDTMPWVIAPIA